MGIKCRDYAAKPSKTVSPATEIVFEYAEFGEYRYRLMQPQPRPPLPGKMLRRLVDAKYISEAEAYKSWTPPDREALREYDARGPSYPWRGIPGVEKHTENVHYPPGVIPPVLGPHTGVPDAEKMDRIAEAHIPRIDQKFYILSQLQEMEEQAKEEQERWERELAHRALMERQRAEMMLLPTSMGYSDGKKRAREEDDSDSDLPSPKHARTDSGPPAIRSASPASSSGEFRFSGVHNTLNRIWKTLKRRR